MFHIHCVYFICLFSSHGILSWLVINLSINRQSSEDPCVREMTGGGATVRIQLLFASKRREDLYQQSAKLQNDIKLITIWILKNEVMRTRVTNGAFPLHGTAWYGTVHFWGVFHWVLYLVPDTFLVPLRSRFQASRTLTKT